MKFNKMLFLLIIVMQAAQPTSGAPTPRHCGPSCPTASPLAALQNAF